MFFSLWKRGAFEIGNRVFLLRNICKEWKWCFFLQSRLSSVMGRRGKGLLEEDGRDGMDQGAIFDTFLRFFLLSSFSGVLFKLRFPLLEPSFPFFILSASCSCVGTAFELNPEERRNTLTFLLIYLLSTCYVLSAYGASCRELTAMRERGLCL